MKKVLFSFAAFAMCISFFSEQVSATDNTARSYASTQMSGCNEKDIIYKERAWSACNSEHVLPGSSYYPEVNSNTLDVNGWKYGRLYEHANVSCPSGYAIPTIQEFNYSDPQFDDILKLPAG